MPASGKTLGLRLVDFEDGSATFEMQVQEHLLNRGGGVQGGFLAALADAAMGTSLQTRSLDGESHATLEFKLNFVRPATVESSPLTAVGRVLYRGRQIGHVEADITDARGRLVAKAISSWVIRKERPVTA